MPFTVKSFALCSLSPVQQLLTSWPCRAWQLAAGLQQGGRHFVRLSPPFLGWCEAMEGWQLFHE